MSEILLCNQPVKADFLNSACGIDANFIHGRNCSNPTTLSAFTPYMLGKKLNSSDKHLIARLSTPKEARELTNFSLSFGGDNTMALAEMTKKLIDYNVGLMGASTLQASMPIGLVGLLEQFKNIKKC